MVDAVTLGRTHGLEVSVRGGGHNVAGRAVTDGSVAAAYGLNYERLRDLKTKFDPTNFFQMNQNIPPRS